MLPTTRPPISLIEAWLNINERWGVVMSTITLLDLSVCKLQSWLGLSSVLNVQYSTTDSGKLVHRTNSTEVNNPLDSTKKINQWSLTIFLEFRIDVLILDQPKTDCWTKILLTWQCYRRPRVTHFKNCVYHVIEVYYNVCDSIQVIKYQDFSPRVPKEIPGTEEQKEEQE